MTDRAINIRFLILGVGIFALIALNQKTRFELAQVAALCKATNEVAEDFRGK